MVWKPDGPADLRLWARFLIAGSFLFSGLGEAFSATGLVVELSPEVHRTFGFQTLAIGGYVQMAGAALLASGRKTRWALVTLAGYVFLAIVFSNLPRIVQSDASGNALGGMVANLAIIGGLLYWLQSER